MASKFSLLKGLMISLLVLSEVILGLGKWRHYMECGGMLSSRKVKKHFVLIFEHIANIKIPPPPPTSLDITSASCVMYYKYCLCTYNVLEM